MSMPEPTPLKPADQTNFLLGQLSGQFASVQSSLEQYQTAQHQVNQTNEAEHAEFRRSISDLQTEQAVARAQQAPKAPWYSVVAGVGGIIAGVVALFGLIAIFYTIAPTLTK